MTDPRIRRSDLFNSWRELEESEVVDDRRTRRTLDSFVARTKKHPGIALAQLEPLSRLEIRTHNTGYEVTVVDPDRSTVVIQGGRYFPAPTRAVVNGSSFGGSLLKLRWIGCGMHLEIKTDKLQVVTSKVVHVRLRAWLGRAF